MVGYLTVCGKSDVENLAKAKHLKCFWALEVALGQDLGFAQDLSARGKKETKMQLFKRSSSGTQK
jgi:hypothetical protein